MRLWRILLDPQGGEGGNGATTETKATEGAGDKGANLRSAAEGLVAKHGDPTAALLVLLGENYQHREKVRELSARLPKDGAVVLEGDDAKHWSHYRELGKPSDLRAALGERDTFKAEATGFRKAELIRTAAEVTTIDGSALKASVLATLAKDLEIEIGEATGKDGKAARVAFVKGEGDTKTPLAEYAAKHLADFLPSLRLEAPAARTGTPTVPRPRTVPAGTGAETTRRVPRSTF